METLQHTKILNGRLQPSASQPSPDLEMTLAPATQVDESQTDSKAVDDEDTKNHYLVRWDENDPGNPKHWNRWYKAWLTLQMALLAFVGSFGASIVSPAQTVLEKEFHVSAENTVLVVSLFVLGYAFGPMIWAPVGEVYGRRLSMLPAVFILGLFSIGTAVSQSASAVFLTRFFGGLFASAPISNVSAAIGDIYDPRTRGVPMALMALCVVGGPCIAPVVGAAILVNPHLGWRWTEYFQAIITFTVVGLTSIALPETYHPVLLKRKAQRLRKDTGDERYWHPHEAENVNLNNILTKYVSRPARMLLTEPMVTCIAVYASFVYGLLFFQLESFPVVFGLMRKYSTVVSTLPFLGLFTGVTLALTINFANQPLYAKAMARNHGRAVPEARLPPMLVGGVLFSAGIFWFGWTADPGYSWVLPTVAAGMYEDFYLPPYFTLASPFMYPSFAQRIDTDPALSIWVKLGFIGAGFNITFQQCLNYLADTYGPFAASAMAGNTFLRSLLACGLPLAARPLFINLGVGPASSLLGGISCVAIPIPLIFMKYGRQLRNRSKFVPSVEDQ